MANNKYIKKAEMEFSHSPLGVLTRAKTLALQSHSFYLHLRSRRLHKHTNATIKRHPHSIAPQKLNLDSTSSITHFAENNLEFEARDRSTRESTPCSSVIREEDTIKTPSSTTKRTNGTKKTRRMKSCVLGNIPSTEEIDEFFAYAEQQQQQQRRLFVDKYNFDIVNDMPLPGRYEWVRVSQ